MGKSGPKYYAVRKGRITGVFNNWTECQKQINGFPGAVFKSFSTKAEAQAFAMEGPGKRSYSTVREREIHEKSSAKPEAAGTEIIYTDGSSLGNGKSGARAGWGVFWGENDPRNGFGKVLTGEQTNNRGELAAIQHAVKTIGQHGKAGKIYEIRADSEYSKNALTVWGTNWERNGWKTSTGQPVKNQDLIKETRTSLQSLANQEISVSIKYVRGHAGHAGNEAADSLARKGAAM